MIVALVAFLAGWLSDPTQDAPVTPVTGARLTVPHVAAPGAGVVAAADYMLSQNPPPPPPAPPQPAVTAPPPPPPIDVSVVFRRELSAIVPVAAPGAADAGLTAVLAESGGGMHKARTLRVGDEFQDGWRLVALTRQTALLKKAKDQRTIVFFGPPVPLPASALPKPPVASRAMTPAPPLAVTSRSPLPPPGSRTSIPPPPPAGSRSSPPPTPPSGSRSSFPPPPPAAASRSSSPPRTNP